MATRRNGSLREHFAARVRQLRTDRGFSQEAFADRCGLHRTYIGSIERAERNVSIDNIERIAEALGVDPSSLFED
jgi:transcriptional regulator with XRE-family HTH domain